MADAASSAQSFSMGSQAVIVKAMKSSPNIPTQVATGVMADFFSDPMIFAPLGKNKARDERLAFIVVFFLGEASEMRDVRDLADIVIRRRGWRAGVQILTARDGSGPHRKREAAM